MKASFGWNEQNTEYKLIHYTDEPSTHKQPSVENLKHIIHRLQI
jgi:hypothetical protein